MKKKILMYAVLLFGLMSATLVSAFIINEYTPDEPFTVREDTAQIVHHYYYNGNPISGEKYSEFIAYVDFRRGVDRTITIKDDGIVLVDGEDCN